MRLAALQILAASLTGLAPVAAQAQNLSTSAVNSAAVQPQDYLQCVPYARQVSGIRIFGDAHTWWDQAEGRYARGNVPVVGAVMAFVPHRNMRLGHVAAVSRVIDRRTVLLRHANWSEINGRRGQIEDNVRAIDVSSANDWSEVRVWYAPINGLGSTHWPVRGFIYPSGTSVPPRPPVVAAAAPAPAPRAAPAPRPARASRDFASRMAMDDLPPPDVASAFAGYR